jgi:cytochrome c
MKLPGLLKSCLYAVATGLLLIAFAFQKSGDTPMRVLVFSKTAGFHHASIDAGKTAPSKMASEKGFSVDFTC